MTTTFSENFTYFIYKNGTQVDTAVDEPTAVSKIIVLRAADPISNYYYIGTETVTIAPTDVAPVAASGTLSVQENSIGVGTLSATGQSALTYLIATQPTSGIVVLSGATYTYTPNADFYGSDSFTFIVTDTMSVASAPATITITVNELVVVPNITLTVSENATVSGTFTVTSGPVGTYVYSISTNPVNGTLVISGTNYTYTPTTGFSGTDSFSYTATDSAGTVSNVGTASITVTQIVVTPPSTITPYGPYLNGATSIQTTTLFPVGTGYAAGNSTGGMTCSLTTDGEHTKALAIDKFVPTTNLTGQELVGFQITLNGVKCITSTATDYVTLDNVFLCQNIVNNQNGTNLVSSPITVTTTPINITVGGQADLGGLNGVTIAGIITSSSYITYLGALLGFTNHGAANSVSFANASLEYWTQPVPAAAPVVSSGTLSVTSNTMTTGTLTISSGSTPVTFAIVTNPIHGTLNLTPSTGTYTYTPATGYGGNDSFTYTATNSAGTSNIGTIAVTVSATVVLGSTVPLWWPAKGALIPAVGSPVVATITDSAGMVWTASGTVGQTRTITIPVNSSGTQHPFIWCRFYEDNVIISNGWMDTTQDYTIAISVTLNGVSLFSTTGYVLWANTETWPIRYYYPANPGTFAQNKNWFPNYDTAFTPTDWNTSKWDMSFGGKGPAFYDAMGTTGGRPDIGVAPGWCVNYYYVQTDANWLALRITEDSGSVWPWHFYDRATGLPVDVNTYPAACCIQVLRGKTNTINGKIYTNPIAAVTTTCPYSTSAEHPTGYGVAGSIVTASGFDQDQLATVANFSAVDWNPAYNSAYGLKIWVNDSRAVAWDMRAFEAGSVILQNTALQSYFSGMLQLNVNALNQHFFVNEITGGVDASWGNGKLHLLDTSGYFCGYPNSVNEGFAPWQNDYFTTAVDWGVTRLGITSLTAIRNFVAQGTLDRFTCAVVSAAGVIPIVYNYQAAAHYSMKLRNGPIPIEAVNSTYPITNTTWIEVMTATLKDSNFTGKTTDLSPALSNPPGSAISNSLLGTTGMSMTGYPTSAYGYPGWMQPALAASVNAGLTSETGVTALEAWATFRAAQNITGQVSDPVAAIVPL